MQKLWALRHHSASRYLIIGLCAFVTQYAVLNLSYYMLSVSLHIATSAGFAAGLAVSFFFNRHWVFGKAGKHKHIAHQGIQYIALVVFNYLFTVVGISFLKKHGVEPYISPVLTTAIITTWNYVLFNKLIFKGEPAEPISY